MNVPFTLESVAKVLPVRQWILLKATDGSLSATLHDYRSGAVTNAETFHFDRGDMVQMKFSGQSEMDSANTPFLKTGQVVASISSNRLGEQLTTLKNQLAVEQANLGVVATGQKKQLINQLEEEINLAKEDLKLKKKTLDRARQLLADGLIAQVELEQAENAHDEAIILVKVSERALSVGATGEKQEAVSLATSKIESLKQQIAFLEEKQSRYLITTPFDGKVRFETTLEGDRLLLEDTSASILLIPVRLRDSRFVQPGQEIELQLVDNETVFTAAVLEVSSRVELLGREQVVTVKALTQQKNLPSGMPIRCRIRCGQVRIAEFLKRSVRWQ